MPLDRATEKQYGVVLIAPKGRSVPGSVLRSDDPRIPSGPTTSSSTIPLHIVSSFPPVSLGNPKDLAFWTARKAFYEKINASTWQYIGSIAMVDIGEAHFTNPDTGVVKGTIITP